MEVLRWRTHLHPILAAAMILILVVWLIVLFRRQRRSRSLRQTVLLLFPKVLIVLLIILAYFDPVRSVVQQPNRDKKIMVLVDTSSSMDCRDEPEISRVERAEKLAQDLAGKLRSFIDLENLDFDVEVHNTKDAKQAEEQIRGTDLGKCLVTIADKADSANYLSAVLLTDGGDELIQTPKLPQVPLYITGVGSSPDSWNDLAVTEVTAPKLVEQGGNFEVSADILARFASKDFAAKVPVAQVKLEEKQQDRWQVRGSEFVRLENPRARAKFSLQAPPESGTNEYRITVQNIEGEISNLNNVRDFSVEVRKETLHVLFFAQELGWDFSMIRKELARDPSVELTALFRLSEQRFIVQGSRQKGDEQLEAGFPSSKQVLDLYKCIIVGSFGAAQWQENQLTALLEYVHDGGAAVFLGGENSFGRGGYGGTIIEPLFPWRISKAQSEFQIGQFVVSVPAAALGNSVIEEATKIISQSDSVSVESLNVEGSLKDGAVTLLEASSEGRYVPLVSMQRYGQGRTMAVATNTLWKWCRSSDELKEAYGYFWQQTVKNMTSWEEGQRFLAIKWDQEQYNPGENASATIRIAGRHDAGQLRLTAEMEVEGKSTPITVEPMMGRENTFKAKMNFARSARYRFGLQAFLLDQLIALKGIVAKQSQIDAEKAMAELLGQTDKSLSQTPEETLENAVKELDGFIKQQKDIMQKRQMVLDQPPEDFSVEDEQMLEDLAIDQSKLAKILSSLVNDLSNMNLLDFGDNQMVNSMKSVYEKAEELAAKAEEAAETRQARQDAYRLETEAVEMAEELMINCEATLGFYDNIQFVAEIPEDEQLVAPLAELPSELEDLVGDLITSEEEMRPEVEDIGSYLNSLDHTAGPVSDGTISSTSAKGKTGDQRPEENVLEGRSGAGRSGMSDSQLVEPVAKDLQQNEYALRERVSNTPLEAGQVEDQDVGAATGGTGLGKTTDSTTQFGAGGKLPPKVLEMMRAALQTQQEIRQASEDVVTKLKRHNLSATELEISIQAMQRLEESIRQSDGIAIRNAYTETVDGLKKSHSAVGSQLAIQYTNDDGLTRKLQNILSRKHTLDFKGYNQMVSER